MEIALQNCFFSLQKRRAFDMLRCIKIDSQPLYGQFLCKLHDLGGTVIMRVKDAIMPNDEIKPLHLLSRRRLLKAGGIFDINAVLGGVIMLTMFAYGLDTIVTLVERRLLRWQPN